MSETDPKNSLHTPEPEHVGPVWKHPYLLYILLTVVLFGGLVVAAWLAMSNDWLPKR